MDSITDAMNMNLSKLWEIVRDMEVWGAAVHGGHRELDTTYQLNGNNMKRVERQPGESVS